MNNLNQAVDVQGLAAKNESTERGTMINVQVKTVDKLKIALIEITDRSIAEGKGDELCSSKFFDDVHNAINELETMLVDEDDVDEFITFSGLVELHIGNDTALQLNQFLKKY